MVIALHIICLAAFILKVQSSSLYFKSRRVPEPQPVSFVTKPNEGETDTDSPILFAHPGNIKPFGFENAEGKLVGFDIDIVSAVCKIAQKKCHVILADPHECTFTYKGIEYSGRGLESNWFAGCPGYMVTPDRMNQFDFTLPYLHSTSSFFVVPGNPKKFNPSSKDYSRWTLIRESGSATNSECLKRQKKQAGTVLVAQSSQEALQALLNGTADALFSSRLLYPGIEKLSQNLTCDINGAGVMLKKGSMLATWWNPAFQKFYMSGEYNALCKIARQTSGVKIQCLSKPDGASPELLHAVLESQVKSSRAKERLWKFVVSGHIYPFSFLNEDGVLVGFTKDMISNVCALAKKKCVLLLARVDECTTRQGELLYPGRGLLEKWFDACTGYYDTLERRNSWDFSTPYLVSNASFYVAKGNPSAFDPESDDYSKFTIVRLATAITNDHCLSRLHKKFYKLLVVNTAKEAENAVLEGRANVWFTKLMNSTTLQRLPLRVHCEHVGTSIMVRKGSSLPSWWDESFTEFYNNGDFNAFCDQQREKYNYNFPCLMPPNVTEEKL